MELDAAGSPIGDTGAWLESPLNTSNALLAAVSTLGEGIDYYKNCKYLTKEVELEVGLSGINRTYVF